MPREHYNYTEIIQIYNTAGSKEAYSHIKERYSIKNPYCLVNRMKKEEAYHYDTEADIFLETPAAASDGLFMDLDELCGRSSVPVPGSAAMPSMEKLVKELVEDRLLQLSQYIQLNQAAKTVLVDQSTMISDGYKVVIH